MKIKINRFNKDMNPQTAISQYEIPLDKPTLLEAFEYISQKIDKSLTFSSGCESSVCGSCGVRVNGKEVLACVYRVQDNDEISPLNNLELIKDLVTDNKDIAKSFSILQIASDDSTCILCNLCYSSCPVFEINDKFANPIILSRMWSRFANFKEKQKLETIKSIQENAIWDCTLCGLCSEVCPQNIDCKTDIQMLQNISTKYSFSNPNFENMSFEPMF